MSEKEIAIALFEFTTYVIDRFDTDDQSGKNQLFVKGVFGGASCGSLVEYAKKCRSAAQSFLTADEIYSIKTR